MSVHYDNFISFFFHLFSVKLSSTKAVLYYNSFIGIVHMKAKPDLQQPGFLIS